MVLVTKTKGIAWLFWVVEFSCVYRLATRGQDRRRPEGLMTQSSLSKNSAEDANRGKKKASIDLMMT